MPPFRLLECLWPTAAVHSTSKRALPGNRPLVTQHSAPKKRAVMTQIPLSGEVIRHLLTLDNYVVTRSLPKRLRWIGRIRMRLHISQVSGNRRRLAIAAVLVVWGNSAVVFADQSSDVAALEAKCEAERQAKIKPLRDVEIAKC